MYMGACVLVQLEEEERLVGREELHAPPEGIHISCCIDALSGTTWGSRLSCVLIQSLLKSGVQLRLHFQLFP